MSYGGTLILTPMPPSKLDRRWGLSLGLLSGDSMRLMWSCVPLAVIAGAGVTLAMSSRTGQSADHATADQHSATYRFWVDKMPEFSDLFTDDYSYNNCLSLLGNELKDKDILVAN